MTALHSDTYDDPDATSTNASSADDETNRAHTRVTTTTARLTAGVAYDRSSKVIADTKHEAHVAVLQQVRHLDDRAPRLARTEPFYEEIHTAPRTHERDR